MANIVDLDLVRRHLRYPSADTADDAALQFMIEAADDAINNLTGDNVAKQFVEFYDGGDSAIFLFHTPVLSIESIQEGVGYMNFELDYVQVNSPTALGNYAYSIDDDDNGYITRRSAGNVLIPFAPGTNNIRITYTAGRNPIPGIIKLAELELISHWWRSSQQMATQQTQQYGYEALDQPSVRGPGSEYTMMNAGIPFKIIEMVRPFRRSPVFG